MAFFAWIAALVASCTNAVRRGVRWLVGALICQARVLLAATNVMCILCQSSLARLLLVDCGFPTPGTSIFLLPLA